MRSYVVQVGQNAVEECLRIPFPQTYAWEDYFEEGQSRDLHGPVANLLSRIGRDMRFSLPIAAYLTYHKTPIMKRIRLKWLVSSNNVGLEFLPFGFKESVVSWRVEEGIVRSLPVICAVGLARLGTLYDVADARVFRVQRTVRLLIEAAGTYEQLDGKFDRVMPVLEPPVYWRAGRPWFRTGQISDSTLIAMVVALKTAVVTEVIPFSCEGTSLLASYMLRLPYCPLFLFRQRHKMPAIWMRILRYLWSIIESREIEHEFEDYVMSFFDAAPADTLSVRECLPVRVSTIGSVSCGVYPRFEAFVVPTTVISQAGWTYPYVFRTYLKRENFRMLFPHIKDVSEKNRPEQASRCLRSVIIIRVELYDTSVIRKYPCTCLCVAMVHTSKGSLGLWDVAFDKRTWLRVCGDFSRELVYCGEVTAIWNFGMCSLDGCSTLLWSQNFHEHYFPENHTIFQFVAANYNKLLNDRANFSGPIAQLIVAERCPVSKDFSKAFQQRVRVSKNVRVWAPWANKNKIVGKAEEESYDNFILPKFSDPYFPHHPYGRGPDGSIWLVRSAKEGTASMICVRPPTKGIWPPGRYKPQ